jgi:hypothetical protein
MKLYTLKPVSGGRCNRTSLNNLGEAASVRNACDLCHAIGHVQSGLGVQVLLATALTASLTLLASFQFESILDSESILEASMSSESGAQAVHWRFTCMGCTARSGGRGKPTFFNDYKSAAVHYARSSQCNRSMHCIKTVTVQLNTRTQHIGDGVAGAGGAPGAWRPQPAPARRAGTMT